MPHLLSLFTPPVIWYAIVAFTISAPYLLLSFNIFATSAWSKFVQIHFFVQCLFFCLVPVRLLLFSTAVLYHVNR